MVACSVWCSVVGVSQTSQTGLAQEGSQHTPHPKLHGQQTAVDDTSVLQWLYFHRQWYPMEIPWSPTSLTLSLQLLPHFESEMGTWRAGWARLLALLWLW